MNPGAIEEAGKAAGGFFEAMRAQPVMLGLVVVIMMQIGLLYLLAMRSSDTRRTELEAIFQNQRELSKILTQCHIDPNVRLEDDETTGQRSPRLNEADEVHIKSVLRQGLDEGLREKIKLLYLGWLLYPQGQPNRAATGASAAVDAYRKAVVAIEATQQ